ncbi:MAG: glycoside hydrolase family 3 C-terminal domain-containing protein [Vicinamibacteria bacterium]
MPKRLRKVLKSVLLSVVAVFLLAAGGGGLWLHRQLQPRDLTSERARWPREMTFEQADRAALDLVGRMTLDEKLHEMTGSGLGPLIAGLLVRDEGVPVYAGGNQRLGIPPIAFTDGPRGVGVGRSTSFPVAMARAATWDVALQQRVGEAIGQEARAQGANYWGGLCLNIVRHPSMGRAEEAYGEDPWLTGEMGAAILGGVQRHNVMACAKHFALNSMETARFKNSVSIDERTLQEVYLPHFRKAAAHDVASFMSAYNQVRGEWAGESRHLLTDVLRGQWGFRGYVTSDWIWGVYDGRRGVHAGLDIEMPSANAYGKGLRAGIESGQVPRSEIDESVRRIVRTKLRFLTRADPQAYPRSLVASSAHTALAREVAEKAMVLLENDGALLPLDRTRVKTLAVVGHLADADNTGDHGSSNVKPPYTTSALKGLRDYLGAGAVRHADGSDLAEVTRVAARADAVVVVAGTRWDEVGEYVSDDAGMRPRGPAEKRPMVVKVPFRKPVVISGGDRVPLALKPRDLDVIRAARGANPRCVVALVGGSVYTMEEWRHDVPAIVMAWYFGMEGGHALARVLFGDVDPSGRMPLTTPRDESQLPFFDEYADTIEYGPYHGYTLADRNGYEPAYPFGYGLGYTTYAYANLQVATPVVAPDGQVDVTVDVTNTGRRAGEEVVQLYVGFAGSQVERPVKLLRAFAKVALAAGETKTVRLRVAARDLAWYDASAKAWRVEPMTYAVLVGPSSRAADLLAARFTVRP